MAYTLLSPQWGTGSAVVPVHLSTLTESWTFSTPHRPMVVSDCRSKDQLLIRFETRPSRYGCSSRATPQSRSLHSASTRATVPNEPLTIAGEGQIDAVSVVLPIFSVHRLNGIAPVISGEAPLNNTKGL